MLWSNFGQGISFDNVLQSAILSLSLEVGYPSRHFLLENSRAKRL